jgi:phosphoribosylaminoimidazolecarboxamide formyltransferase/IMP cyclohydrolase
MNEPIHVRRALLSVSDKSGLVEFAQTLERLGVEIISTGGTLKALREAGVSVRSVSDVTGFPEILDGRVKTLHPKIHAGLLAVSDDPAHRQQLSELDITPIDLVVVNLYPFEKTISSGTVSIDQAIEQIDIGGPAMLRATAKNFKYRAVVCNPARYSEIARELESTGGTISAATRFALAREAFHHTSAYDTVIANFFDQTNRRDGGGLPDIFTMNLPKSEDLRYGENPHQQAALYGEFATFFEKLHGKELSFNNIVDIQAAVELVEEFEEPTVAIIKHTNPCGVGSGETLAESYEKALATDTKSAFGGIVAVNRPLDFAATQLIDKVFTEVIVAPAYEGGVLDFLRKKKDRRIIQQHRALRSESRLLVKTVAGGVLVQTADTITLEPDRIRIVTKRQPTEEEYRSMFFAWRVSKHVKSNAIVFARTDRTIGIGAGQMSRVDSTRIAAAKAREAGLDLRNTAVASDAFFPFADGLLETVNAGATAVIQPGGSVRDEEVIAAANEHNVAMVFPGIRHFRH